MKRWILWPATATKKQRITKCTVHPSDDKKTFFVWTGGRKADALPAERVFETKEAAEDALLSGGKLAWSYKLDRYGGFDEEFDGGKVVRVRFDGWSQFSGTVVKPVDSKGKLTGETFYGRPFASKREAFRSLAERLRTRLNEAEKRLEEDKREVAYLRRSARWVESKGIQVPTSEQLERRLKRRRRRA